MILEFFFFFFKLFQKNGSVRQWETKHFMGMAKEPLKEDAGRFEKTDPRSTDYPLTPLCGLPYGLLRGLPYGLPPRTTLIINQIYFYGGKKHKATCSTCTIKTASLFYIRPIRHRPLFPQWMISNRCGIFNFLICFKCLPSFEPFLRRMNEQWSEYEKRLGRGSR